MNWSLHLHTSDALLCNIRRSLGSRQLKQSLIPPVKNRQISRSIGHNKQISASSDKEIGVQSPEKWQDILLTNGMKSMILNEDSYNVKSWLFFGAAACLTIISLATFQALTGQIVDSAIQAGFKGDVSDLQILDLRNGYAPDEAYRLLETWQEKGRQMYLLIELIDVTCYCSGYRAAFLVLTNRLAEAVIERYPSAQWCKPLAGLPIILAGLDFTEDCAQVACVASFSLAYPSVPHFWVPLVQISSALNVAKWSLVRVGVLGFAVELGALAVGAIVPRDKDSNAP